MKLLIWILLGVCLGPGVFDLPLPPWIKMAAQGFGAVFLFLSGWELRFFNLIKEARFYFITFIGTFLVPFLCGYFFFDGSFFVATAFAISALPVAIQILKEKNLYQSLLSRRVVTLASLCDLVAWIILAFLLPEKDVTGWLLSHWVVLAFFLGILLGRFKAFPPKAYLPRLQMRICAPIFFLVLGWSLDFFALFDFKTFFAIFFVAVSSKYLGSYVASRIAGASHIESFNLSSLLNARGAMEILAASYAYNAQIISGEIFAALVLLGITTAFIAIPTVKAASPS
ncbi:cation:proton antiporter [Bdellovibrio bacteriovorus]|uniref:cation:proton antiporter n=1 Tax=Bdellovibrio bacteriovorus TaxID=959 RepID=UPI0035A67178